jgi:hypothetical protein
VSRSSTGRQQHPSRPGPRPLTTGKLKFQLTELAAIPRTPVVVEEGYSRVFEVDHVRPSVVADGIAECQIRPRPF